MTDDTRTVLSADEVAAFTQFWRDELVAAERYRRLAEVDRDAERASVLRELAATEERHAAHWEARLREAGHEPAPGRFPLRDALLVRVAERFGVDRVLPAIIRAEAADRDRYRETAAAPREMAAEEREHGRVLALASGLGVGAAISLADGRHRTSLGGSLRAAVFGVNDGLVSNLALIMGVAGGTTTPSAVVLAGVAGLVAGAGSMAAGEWISVRSQRELFEREIAVERAELEQFPEEEQHELELIYRAKGFDQEQARALAEQIMADPEVALDTMVREELGLDPDDLGSPWLAAISSFLAFAVGAAVPLLPFLFAAGVGAVVVSSSLSAAALAAVGLAISVLTGRSGWRSALRQVLIGGVTAVATYLIGSAVGGGIG